MRMDIEFSILVSNGINFPVIIMAKVQEIHLVQFLVRCHAENALTKTNMQRNALKEKAK